MSSDSDFSSFSRVGPVLFLAGFDTLFAEGKSGHFTAFGKAIAVGLLQ
jgi:hypothetical protein